MRLSVPAACLALSPVLLAQARVTEAEPNNTPATAQLIQVGNQIDCNLALGEQDWFRFTLAAAGRIRVHTSGVSTTANTRIALLDGTGTTYLAIDDDARGSAQSWSSEVLLNVPAGTYMVQVVPFDTAATGLYALEVATITPVVYDGVEVEPNNSHTTATPTGPLGIGQKRFHGTLSANTVVSSGVAAVPALPPVVNAGLVPASMIVFSGTTVPGSSTTVTQSTPLSQPAANPLLPWYAGLDILMTSGVNAGLRRRISSNTAVAIVSAAFPVANAAGDTYDIVTVNMPTVTWVASLPLGSLYVGGLGFSLRMQTGANAGLVRTINANTGPSAFGSSITTAPFPTTNSQGDAWEIVCTGSTTAFCVQGALSPGAYSPTTGIPGPASLGHFNVRFTSGANNGLTRQISGNTSSSITLASALTAVPGPGDTFLIEEVDSDYYEVVLTAPNTGMWFQICEGNAPAVYGHRYELYDASGKALLPVSSLQLASFGTQSATCSTLVPRTSSERLWPAGTYYIAVRNPPTPFTASATMPGGVIPTGNYMLEVFTMPMDTGSTIVEAEAPGTQTNNTVATANPFVPGQIVRGNLTISTGADPSDWHGPLVIPVPSAICFQTRRNAASPTPMLDTTVNLRNSTGAIALTATNGNILDVPGTSPSGQHGRLVVTSHLSPDTYYIEVTSPGVGTGHSGDYELETSVTMTPPYVAASFFTFASNAGCGSAPQPLLTRQYPSEVPATGTLFSRQLTNMTPSFFGMHVMGIANIPPLDLALPLGGTLGACFLNVSPDLVSVVFTDPAGIVELQFIIPGSIALRGTVLWEQGVDFDPTAPNGLFAQPGHYGRFIVGERSY